MNRGGTGGDEAALFAGDLFRMYQKFAETRGWQLAVSSFTEGTAGGYKEIVFTRPCGKLYVRILADRSPVLTMVFLRDAMSSRLFQFRNHPMTARMRRKNS